MGAFTPTVKMEVAFTTDPLADTPSYTDISTYVQSVNWKRGRQRDRDSFQAGTCQILLDNSDRRFDPQHATGPYFGNLEPNKKVCITVTHSATPYVEFVGFVDGWPQTYDRGNAYSSVNLTATDGFKLLGRAELGASALESFIARNAPTNWWKLNESSGNAIDYGTNPVDGIPSGSITYGSSGLDAGTDDTAYEFDGTGLGVDADKPDRVRIPAGLSGWSSLFCRFEAQGDTENHTIFCDDATVGVYVLSSSFGANAGKLYVVDESSLEGTLSTSTYNDGTPHTLLVVSPGAANHYDIYVDGSDVTDSDTNLTVGHSSLHGGHSWIGSPPGSGTTLDGRIGHVALFGSDISGDALNLHDAAGDDWTDEDTGARIGRLLDLASWPSADRDLDTGDSTLGTADVAAGNMLAYAQKVERTEQGRLFINRSGNVTFHSRNSRFTEATQTSSQQTFSDDGSDLGYFAGGLRYDYDDQLVVNDCTVTPADGVSPARYVDSTSVTAYGRRSESLATLTNTNSEARNLAEWRVTHFKDPLLRVSQLRIKPETDEANLYPALLVLEPGYRVTVERTPQGTGSQISQETIIEGMDWSFSRSHDVMCVLWLSPADTQVYATWDTAEWDEASGTPEAALWGF